MGAELPDILPGHWETDEGSGMAKHYLAYHPTRATLHAGHLSDFMVAHQIAMTGRGDLAFEGKLATAKDRIRWLSAQLAIANATTANLSAALEWIHEVAERQHEEDEKLRAQGARTLRRISERAADVLAKNKGAP